MCPKKASVLILAILLLGCLTRQSKTVCHRNFCIHAEVANSIEKRRLGLMFRENLAEDQGMLFVYPEESPHSFWMKNMHFPLDMIWIGHDKKIVDITENVQPCGGECGHISASKKAQYVLEVKSGFTKRHEIKIGDRLRF